MADGLTIRGLEPLLEARLQGRLLAREVLLWCDHAPAKWHGNGGSWLPEGRVKAGDDLRVLLNLDVLLVAETLSAEVAALLEQVKKYARSVVFVALQLSDGTVWDRECGEWML